MNNLKSHVQCLFASMLLIAAIMMSVFTVGSTSTFAAACDPAAPLDASAGSASCDMAVNVSVNSGGLTLANDAAATITNGPITLTGVAQNVNFSFTSLVKDHRGSTNGWSLQAASAGIVNANGVTTYNLALTAQDVATACTNGTCPAPAFTAVSPLTTTTQTFQQAGNTGHTAVVDGDYSIVTDGQFNLPQGAPSGAYAGTVTITLTNTF